MITIDTLRADRVGAYGNTNHLTPAIDRLAARGVRFAHAFTHAPMTLPAHTSILTGLTPRQSGVRNNTTFRLDDRVPTLATFLKGAGYRTGAFISAFVLESRFGLARDFDVYDDHLPRAARASFQLSERAAADVAKLAGDWILTGGSSQGTVSSAPWFAWVHFFDPHAPYHAPAEYQSGRSPYDAEVAYTDATLGAFFERLQTAQALDHTLVVLTADHGESLGEHGETTHGLFAYQSTLAVPLIVNGTGVPAAVVDPPVAHADIVPTILDLVGARVPDGLDGQSLVGEPRRDRPVYFEALDASLTRGWAPLRGIVRDGWKYIDLPEAELYDLQADPAETRSRIDRDPHGEALAAALKQIESKAAGSGAAAAVDREAAARLRTLGYVGGSPSAGRGPRLQDDPKRLVALNEQFNSALTAFDEGRGPEALTAFLAILRARPDFLSARTSAATVLVSQGRASEAVRLLREAPAEQQGSTTMLAKLGAAQRDAGDLREAAVTLEAARKQDAHNLDINQDLAIVYAALGRTADARALFMEIVTENPQAATAWYNLGLLELQTSRAAAAANALQRAVARDPSYGEAWQALGAALVGVDRKKAIEAWQHAERLLPRDYDLLFNLAMVTAESPDPASAVPYLERFAREAPPEKYARDIAQVRGVLARIAQRSAR